MQPIAPLMIEHRIIERMIRLIGLKLEEFKKTNNPNELFIDSAVDFIRTYADQTHHGKEENILFRELQKKNLSAEHKKTMDELIQEHVNGRKITSELVASKNLYFSGRKGATAIILQKMEFLVDFYPKHIEKEDEKFFLPVMSYFSPKEQDRMLKEGQVFDRKMIHRKYGKLTSEIEERLGVTSVMSKEWLEYL